MELDKTEYYDGCYVFIDAHGSDHGLFVGYNPFDRTITMKTWNEACEPNFDTGKYDKWLTVIVIELSELLTDDARKKGYHLFQTDDSQGMQHRIIDAVLAYNAYWGGETEYLDPNDVPCNHFCMNWGKHQANHRLGCSLCKEYCGEKCTCHGED
jgi:hypothetical protein